MNGTKNTGDTTCQTLTVTAIELHLGAKKVHTTQVAKNQVGKYLFELNKDTVKMFTSSVWIIHLVR